MTERAQDIKFTKGQIRETARLPSGPERALQMKRDREMEGEEEEKEEGEEEEEGK